MFGTNDEKGIPTAANLDHLGVTVPDPNKRSVFSPRCWVQSFSFLSKRGHAQAILPT
jgi:hypothetical protein